MKNKPLRHKDENTFKFQPFAERIANIDVDIFHRVAHPNEEIDTEDLECVFHQTVQKWNVLNLSESYGAFCKEVYGIITLPQLLHKKDYVVEVLVRHIKLKNPLSLQPLLELVVAFAKDLRKEFYPYYTIFLNTIIELLNTKDTEQLEWTFTCLAYLFKFLWRYLVKDIGDVFISLLPLLSDNQPPYINNFAAESFSFVARKVKDRESFLSLIIKAVQNKQDGISGCGKLLFDVIRGVAGHFHSCANATLSFYFDSLSNDNLPQDVYYDILQQIINNMVQNVHAKNMEIYWKTLLVSIDKSIEQFQTNPTEEKSKNLELLLKLISLTLSYKSGRMLNSYDGLVKHYLKMISIESLPENVQLELSNIGSLLLNSMNIQLTQENASLMIRKTLQLKNKKIILDFIDKLTSYSSFEPLILPVFLKYFGSSLDPNAFKILTKLILKKSPLAQNGIKLDEWKKYPLEFSNNSQKVFEYFLNFISVDDVEEILQNMNDFLSSLICLPHINSLDNNLISKILEKNIELVFNEIKVCDEQDTKKCQQLLFILSVIIECTIDLSDSSEIKQIDEKYKLVEFILRDLAQLSPFTICALRIVDMIVTSIEDTDFISLENLKKLDENLIVFLSSPLHQVRLLATHIYSLFDKITEFNMKQEEGAEKAEAWNVFTICYKTESIEPLVHTYRDQLQLLQKLSYDKPQSLMVQKTDFTTIPLRYFLGCLYMNFQLIWEPIIQLIESYAHGMPAQKFWDVFSNELKGCADRITKQEIDSSSCGLVTDVDFIYELGENMFKVDNKPDFVNYRMLLWKAMASFADIAETKTRDISVLMLSFIENEYRATNINEAFTWNIKQTSENTDDTVVEEDNVEQEDEDENAAIKKELNKSVGTTGKTHLKTLLTKLNVFTKMRSPKSMYREPELYKLYLELLSHRNSEVQKTALDCIMVYKHKFLTPYKDHLYALIDDKKFKNELALFRIDKETTVVQEEHRKELIPIVLRIVHSKMMAKTGMRTGGKSSGQLRRSLVLRFLAGCHEQELMQFIHMSFKYYADYIKDNPEEMIAAIVENVDLEKFIPPKRLQSTLNLLLVVLEQFGGLMGQQLLNYLMKILLVIGAAVLGAMAQKQNIHAGYLASLRNIRTTCQTILGRFFAHFDKYLWTSAEINAVFDVFIWPWLDKLTTEGIHSPTALLKLFHQWGLNPRYFILFVKRHEKTEQYVLPQIIKLLRAPKVHPSVTNTILEILEKLLSLKVDEEETAPPLEVPETEPIAENILERLKINDELNYGSCILLPFVPDILEKFKRKLANKHKGINQRELFIMSRISELVWEPETCDIVLALVLPMVVRKASLGASDETIFQLVQTVYNLIKSVAEPHKHLRKIAPLFGEVSSTQTRKLLCEILHTISSSSSDEKLSEKLQLTFDVVKELNAFDKKWLDQPDFDRRHKAFKQINALIASDSIHFELGAIIIYNCFYFIRHENDLALRESSTLCLRGIVPYLAVKFDKSPNEKDYLFNEILFQMIRKGIKSKNNHFRHEAISLLGHLARECSESNSILRDLSTFTNKQDMEVDFFENLLHLQLYRQTRALNRFNSIAKELLRPLNPRTLTQFILPLISSYLLNDKYSSKNSLMDATIECVKIICQMLPWHHYESILKYYLGQLRFKLEFQKQLVKLTVAILDAYHFDLSRGKASNDKDFVDKVQTEEIVEIAEKDKTDDNEEKSKEEPKEDDDEEEKAESEKDIDEILEEVVEEIEVEEEPVKSPDVPAILRQTVLCPSGAKRVVFSIKTILLPQLHKAMAEMTHHEGSHKVNRKRTGFEREEEELQKVPISLAVVKLLQKLPTYILERNLPGVFMKTCTFLKSHLDSVRRVTREILQKIMITLGPKYLGLLISEMSTLLSRGFQVHVLVYTIHSILVSLKESFQPTDIDKCLLTILDVCKVDLFGNVADEKEISKIITKTSEAKATKSYDTFQILAQFITEKCLMDLLLPLKDTLTHSHSFKVVNKVQECLRRIVLGLVDNTFIPVETLLVFAFGTASESIPQFISHEKPKLTDTEMEKKSREKPDCFIIPKPPTYKSGNRLNHVRNSKNTNAHLLVEFGLRLCYFVLKRDKVQVADYLKYIDPFVGVFKNCLTSRHVKMCTLTIQCLSWVMKYELPTMEENIQEITTLIFELLHKYAAAGLSKGDNFDLVVAAFKAMAILVRDVKYYIVTTEQLKALLLYAEQDLHDYDRQATAFALLKSIITRKLIIPEIHDVMDKVAELSITSDLAHVRLQSRQVFHQFLMDYPLGKKLEAHLSFYMSQLNYELQPGRESALEMINGIILSFPMKILKQQAGMFFVILGARLINDDSPECRKMVAKCLQNLLERLEKVDRNTLFDIVKSWFNDKKINHRRLAAQLCGLIITVEKSNFTSRLPELTPLIKVQLCPKLADETPGKFVRINASKNLVYSNNDNDEHVKPRDHQLFQLLQMLLKLCANCPTFLNQSEEIETISQYVQTLLGYPHEWVRISAAQFIGFVLSKLKIDHLSDLLVSKKCDEHGYLYSDPANTIKSLSLDLCAQLLPGHVKPEMAEQIIKNLVFLARVLEKVPINGDSLEDDAEDTPKTAVNLFWLTKRMRKIVNREIVEAPKSTVVRTEVFKWIAGIVTLIDAEKIKQILHHLLAPIVRELGTTEESNSELRQLAKEVGNLLKKKVGTELYISTMSKLQTQLNVRRAERKRERVQLAVTNPDIAAKKKIKLQVKKKDAKKRKMEMIKGKKPFKKRKKAVEIDE